MAPAAFSSFKRQLFQYIDWSGFSPFLKRRCACKGRNSPVFCLFFSTEHLVKVCVTVSGQTIQSEETRGWRLSGSFMCCTNQCMNGWSCLMIPRGAKELPQGGVDSDSRVLTVKSLCRVVPLISLLHMYTAFKHRT